MSKHNVREFAKTLTSQTRVGKIDIRERVLMYFKQLYDSHNDPDTQFKIVTLPSMYWIVEEIMLKYAKSVQDQQSDSDLRKRGLTIKGFERDWKLFSVAAIKIPSGYYSVIDQHMSDMNYQVIRSRIGRNLVSIHNIDVFEYLSMTDNTIHFMWIDTTAIIDTIADKLIHIKRTLSPGGIAVLSFIKGRQRVKITNRCEYVISNMGIGAKEDMEIVEVVEYHDTTTMFNIFMRKKPIDNKQKIENLIKSTM